MVLHFALELGQNFDKRFNPDLPNLKTLLVKERSCFALYTSIRSSCTMFSKCCQTKNFKSFRIWEQSYTIYHSSKLSLNPFNPQYYGPVPMFMNWVPQLNAYFRVWVKVHLLCWSLLSCSSSTHTPLKVPYAQNMPLMFYMH